MVEGAGVVVVGSGVVRMQEGGVHEESEKSPVLPNTCAQCVGQTRLLVSCHTLVMKAYSSLHGILSLRSSNSMIWWKAGKGLEKVFM